MDKARNGALVTATIALGISAATAGPEKGKSYEVWASDQSNSTPYQPAGTAGSFIWIWDSHDIERQIAGGADARPLGCDVPFGSRWLGNVGPCNLLDVFPQDLAADD